MKNPNSWRRLLIAVGAACASHAASVAQACDACPIAPPQAYPHCELVSADLPAGATAPTFDPASWSAFSPRSGVVFTVSIVDPTGTLAPYAAGIESNLLAAANRWGQFLHATSPVTIDIRVTLDNSFPRATGRSTTTGFVAFDAGYNIFEQGVAYEVRTGVDPNGALEDVQITLSEDYTANELWFDPDPATRTIPVPSDRTDAVSVFLHELGHVIAFNGWRDNFSGSLPADYQSTFDALTNFDGDDFFFRGPVARSLYNDSDVPLTFGNAKHVGNPPPRPGADLIPDMMNGVVYYRGVRYDITPMTQGVSVDAGVLVPTPCDSLDFNRDELFPDSADLDDFVNVLAGGPPACSTGICGDIDFNNDGLFPDSLDLDAFISRLAGGACL